MSDVDDLIAWLHQQLENQRFRGESLKTLAFALPPETGAYLTETGDLLLAEVDAKRRILRWLESRDDWAASNNLWTWDSSEALRLLALPYANRPGYRDEWKPVTSASA